MLPCRCRYEHRYNRWAVRRPPAGALLGGCDVRSGVRRSVAEDVLASRAASQCELRFELLLHVHCVLSFFSRKLSLSSLFFSNEMSLHFFTNISKISLVVSAKGTFNLSQGKWVFIEIDPSLVLFFFFSSCPFNSNLLSTLQSQFPSVCGL